MFLVLTANENFWDKTQPLLFLGEWCRLHSRRNAWRALRHEVVHYPWDDLKRLYNDFLILEELYERFLLLLSARLNSVWGVIYTTRYWRIVIGPWLFYFMQSFYERYVCLLAAAEHGGVDGTLIPPENEHQPVADFADCIQRLSEDDYNLHIYGDIIRQTGMIQAEEKSNPEFSSARRAHRTLSDLFRSWFWRLGRYNRAVLVESSFPFRANFKIHWRRREIPLLGCVPQCIAPEKIDWELRKPLSLGREGDPIETLLCHAIPRHLPRSYLEGRESIQKWGQDLFPRSPKVILTANAAIGSDVFKMWAAEHSERGVPLVLIQHGGHYGCGQWNSQETHECNVSDRYYSWGWRSPQYSHVVPFVAPRLIRSWPKPRKGGHLLMALMSAPRYAYWMYSIPSGPQHVYYINDQRRFLHSLPMETRRRVIVRMYPKDWGWSGNEILSEEFPDVTISPGHCSMLKELKEASLFIGTYNATTFLETFTANFPTVLFWDPRFWKLRESARPFFDDLKKAGILYDSAEAAAAFVAQIAADPMAWWEGGVVQSAVKKFCGTFARHSENAIEDWIFELDRLTVHGEPK